MSGSADRGRVVVLAPMRVELDAVVKAAGLERRDGPMDRMHTGVVGDVDVFAGLAGIGITPSAHATEVAIAELHPDHVIVSGIAGGIGTRLAIGDLVVPERVNDAATGDELLATALGPTALFGRLITTAGLWSHDELVSHPLVADGGAVAVDMETSAIAAVCARHGVPWTAFRGISDRTADGLVTDDVMALTRPDGSTDGKAVAKLLARRPWIVPKLARLARDTGSATSVAAAATVAACTAWRDCQGPMR